MYCFNNIKLIVNMEMWEMAIGKSGKGGVGTVYLTTVPETTEVTGSRQHWLSCAARLVSHTVRRVSCSSLLWLIYLCIYLLLWFFFFFLWDLFLLVLCVLVFACMHVCVSCVCAWPPEEARIGHCIPWTWSHRWLWRSCGCWEPNPCLLEEWRVLVTAEPFPQPFS